MHPIPKLRRLAAAAMAVAALVLVAGPAAADDGQPPVADCIPAPGLEAAISSGAIVFVGTVTADDPGGRSATVEVKDIWSGGQMPEIVSVDGSRDPGGPTEDDRTFEVGRTYLFLPVVVDGRLVDSICSATASWTDDLAAMRPLDAHSPAPVEGAVATGPAAIVGDLALPVLTAALIGGAALTIAFVVARRRDA